MRRRHRHLPVCWLFEVPRRTSDDLIVGPPYRMDHDIEVSGGPGIAILTFRQPGNALPPLAAWASPIHALASLPDVTLRRGAAGSSQSPSRRAGYDASGRRIVQAARRRVADHTAASDRGGMLIEAASAPRPGIPQTAAAVTDSCVETTFRTATRCFDMRPNVAHVPTHLTPIRCRLCAEPRHPWGYSHCVSKNGRTGGVHTTDST